jgi:hypothetical protein
MKFTNRLGLPETFFQAIINDKYSREGADYSITELINPPQLTILKRRYSSDIVEDISDRIWSLIGRSVHYILESADQHNALQEERIITEVSGRTVSGQFDLYYADGKISDFKVTSVWSVIYGTRKKEWTQQLNGYAYLLRTIGFDVTQLEIVAIFRDWSPSKADETPDYPENEVQVIPVELWTYQKQREFLESRIELLKANETLPDHHLTPCSLEEMWETPVMYAVKKINRKTAVRVFDKYTEAQEMITRNGSDYYIETRPGVRARCEGKTVGDRVIKYCPVREFCHQYQEYRNQHKGGVLMENLTKLNIPCPPAQIFENALGYKGENRWVAFYWDPCGDEIMWNDGIASADGQWPAWLTFVYHPIVAPLLNQYNLGGSDEEAEHWLLLDRAKRVFYIGDRKTVHEFLVKSAPTHPFVHITEEEIKGFIQEVKKSISEINPSIDLEAIFRENERNFNALQGWLDSQVSVSSNYPI